MNAGPVRILHVLDSLENGGLENGVLNLIRHMDGGQFEHSVCTIRAQGVNAARLPAGRVQLVHVGKREGSHFQLPELRRAIRENQPDIVHSRNWGAIEAVAGARLAGHCKVIHSEHGFEAGTSAHEPLRRRIFRRLTFELADRVLCVSNQLRNFHSRQTGFSASRMTVIHNGVDSERFRPDAAARVTVRREFGIGESEFCIGCVGNLLPVKDHRTLLNALRLLGETASSWRVLVAGEGPERPDLEQLARGLSGRLQISFPGRIQNVPELLNAFDVYVLPSVNEGISNSLLEAMATGLPAIASDVGGNPEVMEDGASGMLFPVGDASCLSDRLLQLYAHSHLRGRLGEGARRRAREEFSIRSMVGKYEALYRGVLAFAASAPKEAEA